jgi:tryptophan synthase alpha chain
MSASPTRGGRRIAATVARCHAEDRGAFVPFLVIGDPTFDQSLALADVLVDSGADALELGLPFSDPPADGPVIQAADGRALAAGMTTARVFEWLAAFRKQHDTPISLLVYLNLVLQYGVDAFYARCGELHIDAVLVADLPPEHAAPVVAAGRQHNVATVFLASELSTPERLARIATVCDGYVYALARVGITGEQRAVDAGLSDALGRMTHHIPLPHLVGFGISSPAHVRAALAAGADGVIVGSAIVRRIADHLSDPPRARAAVAETARSLRAATEGLAALRSGTPRL